MILFFVLLCKDKFFLRAIQIIGLLFFVLGLSLPSPYWTNIKKPRQTVGSLPGEIRGNRHKKDDPSTSIQEPYVLHRIAHGDLTLQEFSILVENIEHRRCRVAGIVNDVDISCMRINIDLLR